MEAFLLLTEEGFCSYIPLNDTAMMKLDPMVSDQVLQNDIADKILQYCKAVWTKKEIAEYIVYKTLTYMAHKFLKPLLEGSRLVYTIPEDLQSRLPKYITKE